MNKNADLLEYEHFFSMTFNNVAMNLLFACLTYYRLIVIQDYFHHEDDNHEHEDDNETFTPE